MIQDIMDYEVNQEDWLLQLGDWVHECDPSDSYYSATRSSDFILQYFPVFEAVTGDERWGKLYDGTCAVIESITAEQSTGLLPDFIVKMQRGNLFQLRKTSWKMSQMAHMPITAAGLRGDWEWICSTLPKRVQMIP